MFSVTEMQFGQIVPRGNCLLEIAIQTQISVTMAMLGWSKMGKNAFQTFMLSQMDADSASSFHSLKACHSITILDGLSVPYHPDCFLVTMDTAPSNPSNRGRHIPLWDPPETSFDGEVPEKK
ncbi:hypothetical protein ACF0H5_006859 [Mactra antiquata]